MNDPSLLEPSLQYGAFAICLALVGLLYWYLRFSTKLLNTQFKALQDLHTETNHTLATTQETISKNTLAVTRMADQAERQENLLNATYVRLIDRPCLRDKHAELTKEMPSLREQEAPQNTEPMGHQGKHDD